MYKKVDILGSLPREIAYQVASQFSPKEYIVFCRVSTKWAILLHSDLLANEMIRKHFGRYPGLAYYKDVEDRFSVLRNLVFRDHAQRAGLVMKTKWVSYPGHIDITLKYCHGGILAVETMEETHSIRVLELDRKAESPFKRILDPRDYEFHKTRLCWAGPDFIVEIDKGSKSEVTIYDYSGYTVDKWCMKVPGALDMKYLLGCTDLYVVIRMEDFTGRLVHYEVWDAITKDVTAYDIEEDLLSKRTVLAREAEELDGDDHFSHQDLNWAVRDCSIRIQNDTKTILLSNRSEAGFLLQRLAFSSQTNLENVSETTANFVLPPYFTDFDEYGIPEKRVFTNCGHGVITAAADLNWPRDVNVDYIWYDYNHPQDGVENIQRESWTILNTQKTLSMLASTPYTIYARGTLFPMGETLYSMMAPSRYDPFMRLRHLGKNENGWSEEEVELGIPQHTDIEVFCDDKYAIIVCLGGILVLEWHDFDSWWESQVEKRRCGETVEIRHEFWKDDGISLANFRQEPLNVKR